MKFNIGALLVLCFFACPALAQPATIAVYPVSAIDANATTPVATPVQYTPTCGLSPKQAESPLPLVDPLEGYYDDPADITKDCRVPLATQMAALPVGSYKAAVKVGTSIYSPLSTAFAVSAAQVTTHPCDGVPPTTGTVVEGSRLLIWCWDGKDANGNATTITQWVVYFGATRQVLTNILAGSTVNSQGLRDYRTSVPLTRGTYAIQYAAVNATGESQKSGVFTLTVTPAPAVPTAPVNRGAN